MSTSRFKKGAMRGIDLAIAATEPAEYIFDGDNFTTLAHTNAAILGGYDSTGSDAGGTMVLESQLPGNALQIGTDGDDNDGTYLSRQTGATDNMIGAFDITIDSGRVLAYECKFKVVQGAEVGIFVGLGEYGNSDQDMIVDSTGALISEDAIGFHCVMQATDVDIDGVTRISGGSMIVGAETMTEDEDDKFHVYGFRFDGGTTIDWYLDNEIVASQTLVASEFPTGQSLNPIFVIKTGEDVEKDLTIDYWQCVECLLSGDNLAD